MFYVFVLTWVLMVMFRGAWALRLVVVVIHDFLNFVVCWV